MPNDIQLISHSFTEHATIHTAHQELEKLQNDLNETCRNLSTTKNCQSCSKELVACCKGRLSSYAHDFICLVEERMLQDELEAEQDPIGLLSCQVNHDKLWSKVNNLAEGSVSLARTGSVAEGYSKLHGVISDILEGNDEYQVHHAVTANL